MDTDPAELALWAPRLLRRLPPMPALRERRHRSAERRLPHLHQRRPRRGDAARRVACRRSRTRCTTRSASGRSPPSSASPTSTAWCWKPTRPAQADPDCAATCCACRGTERRAGAAGRDRHDHPHRRRRWWSRTRSSSPSVTLELRPRARRLARRRGARRSRAAEQEIGMPETITGSYSGDAAEFQQSLAGRALADPGRGRGDLHRAGRAVRELDPPDHHPLHAALGRHRRAAGADAVRASICRWSRWSASCC